MLGPPKYWVSWLELSRPL